MQADKSKLKSRAVKGYPLTHAELDGNFTELSKLIDDVTTANQDIDAIELDVAQKETESQHAINVQSDRITALTDVVAVIDNAKQDKLAAAYNDNVLANANKVWGLNAAGTGYEWKDPRVAAGLPTPVGQAKKLLGVKADGTLEYQVVGQKIGDILFTRRNPGASYLRTGKPYLKTSYTALATLLGTVSDGVAGVARGATNFGYHGSSMAYGAGLFVMPAQDQTGYGSGVIYTSPDGVTWTTRSGAFSYLGNVQASFVNNHFTLIGKQNGSNQISVQTSPDGITWTAKGLLGTASNSPAGYGGIIYAAGLYVAPLQGSTSSQVNQIQTSPDCVTWTVRTIPAWQIYSVQYGNGKFVALATSGTSVPSAYTSSDGITWTLSATFPRIYYSMSFGNGIFMAITSTGYGVTSTDGITWTEIKIDAPIFTAGMQLVFAAGVFATASGYTSPDGLIWTLHAAPTTESKSTPQIAYGPGYFMVMCYTGQPWSYAFSAYDTATQFYVPDIPSNSYYPAYIKALEVVE